MNKTGGVNLNGRESSKPNKRNTSCNKVKPILRDIQQTINLIIKRTLQPNSIITIMVREANGFVNSEKQKELFGDFIESLSLKKNYIAYQDIHDRLSFLNFADEARENNSYDDYFLALINLYLISLEKHFIKSENDKRLINLSRYLLFMLPGKENSDLYYPTYKRLRDYDEYRGGDLKELEKKLKAFMDSKKEATNQNIHKKVV